jgi:hypothetical protein
LKEYLTEGKDINNVRNNPEVKKGTLQFSDKIEKYSRFINKNRILAINKDTIFNMDGPKIKKKIQIKNLTGISKLTTKGRKLELVFHAH